MRFPVLLFHGTRTDRRDFRDVQLHTQEADHPLVNAFRSQVQWLPRAQNVNPLAALHPVRWFVIHRNMKTMRRFLGAELDKRFKSLDLTADPKGPEWKEKKSITDLALQEYLKEARAEGREVRELDKEFKENAITQALIFIFAGHDTVSSTVCVRTHI